LCKELLTRAQLADELPTWAEEVKRAGDDAAHPYARKGKVTHDHKLEEVLCKDEGSSRCALPQARRLVSLGSSSLTSWLASSGQDVALGEQI
jgi:hypothetical protein